MAIREQERSSIARELHDELGQALTRLNIDVTWLTQQLPARLRTRRVAAMGPLVDRTIRTVQQISSQLRPPVLDDLGLEAAIEWHVREFAEWSGCRCELDLRIGAMPKDRDRDIAIFRILQEALTNVARHARAEIVKVRAERDEEEFLLEIEDDGIGIPVSQALRAAFLWSHWHGGARRGPWRRARDHRSSGTRHQCEVPSRSVGDTRRRRWLMIRLLIADDHEILREGLKYVVSLSRDISVVGEADDAESTLQLCRTTPADVLLLDVSMPGPGVLDTIKASRRSGRTEDSRAQRASRGAVRAARPGCRR